MGLRDNRYLKAAKRCLALGQVDEALLALSRIPFCARNQPEFRRLKRVLASILPQITEAILHAPNFGPTLRRTAP